MELGVDVLGVLGGSGYTPQKTDSYTFVVMRPDLLLPIEDFRRHVGELIARIKATPLQPGFGEIRIPSERSYRERARNRAEGIVIDRKIHDDLHALIRNGVPPVK